MTNIVLADKLSNSVIESLVDGEGVRLVVFFCGCPHKCKLCHNPTTWNINNGVSISIDDLSIYLKAKYLNGNYSGITFSGGDPMYQKDSLLLLAKKLKDTIPEINIWSYTGYLYEDISEYEVLKYIDTLVDGKFEADKKYPKKPYRGSYNQRILRLKNSKIQKIE